LPARAGRIICSIAAAWGMVQSDTQITIVQVGAPPLVFKPLLFALAVLRVLVIRARHMVRSRRLYLAVSSQVLRGFHP
jgi:hypothetical protein